jgi:hypothetical protein
MKKLCEIGRWDRSHHELATVFLKLKGDPSTHITPRCQDCYECVVIKDNYLCMTYEECLIYEVMGS